VDVNVWGIGWRQKNKKLQKLPALSKKNLRQLVSLKKLKRNLCRLMNLVNRSENESILPEEICGLPLSDEDMIKMYSRCKISLGFSGTGQISNSDERIVQIRLRDFESVMCGSFYIIEYMKELEEFFKIEKEIVCYSTKEELIDKIKFYLRHETEREKIRKAGYQRALRCHTWQKRFKDVFNLIGLN
jgi:hypothetical protein